MTTLTLYNNAPAPRVLKTITDAATITATLAPLGIRFEQWPSRPLPADDAGILDAFAPEIKKLQQEGGYAAVDVVRLSSTHLDKITLRQKFLKEHTHEEDEVRFFVAGEALFYLRTPTMIAAITTGAGDLISVPASMPHWFDMGEQPNFCAIRLFTNPTGWVAHYTGDEIAGAYPLYAVSS